MRAACVALLPAAGPHATPCLPPPTGPWPAPSCPVPPCLQVSRNQLTGPFPSVAYTNTSFMRMQSFNIGNNRMRCMCGQAAGWARSCPGGRSGCGSGSGGWLHRACHTSTPCTTPSRHIYLFFFSFFFPPALPHSPTLPTAHRLRPSLPLTQRPAAILLERLDHFDGESMKVPCSAHEAGSLCWVAACSMVAPMACWNRGQAELTQLLSPPPLALLTHLPAASRRW